MDALGPLKRLSAAIAATGVQNVGWHVRDGVPFPVWPEGATPTEADRAKVAAVCAAFRLDDDAAQKDFDAEAEIDAVPDAVVDLILAAKALPPNATAAELRERAKADRRARGVRP
jgi:predicted ATPase